MSHFYKSRGRDLALAAVSAASMLFSMLASAAPPRGMDSLVESALTSALKTPDAAQRTRDIAAARLDIETRAAQFPGEVAKAKVVLSRGVTAAELQQLASAAALELTQVEAKIPVPGSTEVYTILLTGAALERAEGNIGNRVTNALASAQGEFLKLALADPQSSAKYRSLSRNPLLVYAFDSIGTNSALATLGNSTDVKVVQRLPADDASQELHNLRSLRESMRELRVTPASQPTTQAVPVCNLRNDTASVGAGTLRSTAGARDVSTQVVCPPEPSEDPIELPTTPLPTPTGVPFVDAGLAGNNQYIDGYRDLTGTGNGKIQISMPPEFWLNCDSGVPGNLCPNDYTYTTRGITGGTTAWGAAIQQAGGPVNTVECTLVYNWPGNDTVGSYSWYCYRVVYNRPKWTYAAAVSKFSFGPAKTYVPVTVENPNTNPFTISTFAWNGVPQAAHGGPAECRPNGSPWDVARPCQSYDRDGSWVNAQSGFEDKIIIPNPHCTLGTRTGSTLDKNYGCFSADRFITNLPTPYLDTTFLDNGGSFTASIGVVNGRLLIPGFPYESRVDGSAKGWENIRGLTARHVQAVTARDDVGAPCITGVGGAPAGGGAACMFNVDISVVGPDKIFR